MWRMVTALLVALPLAYCGSASSGPPPRTVQPGAPGEASRVGVPAAPARSGYTEADVAFMQGMLTHHAQALAMTELVPERTDRSGIRQLARRIEISQESEMALMSRWLEERGESAAMAVDGHAAHDPGAPAAGGDGRMPGMATPEEMARLAAARDDAFDRLFLELMIRHHEGALVMVDELLATEGAGQEPELFQFAAHVDADQRAEIQRMRTLHNALFR